VFHLRFHLSHVYRQHCLSAGLKTILTFVHNIPPTPGSQSTMAAAAAASPMQQQSSFGQARQWVPSLPTNLIASLNPFAAADKSKDITDAQQTAEMQRSALSLLAQSSGPPSPTKSSVSVMFAEPESQGTSLSGSREGSIDGKRRTKRNNKPKTTYTICHPPPASSARQKMHRRPRSLLQLHKVVPNSRPLPAYEIIPSANFSVRLTRATTKVFRAKHSLCPNDLVVLRAEDYYTEEPEEDQEARDVVALICKGRKEDGATAGKAKICMVDGGEWEAYPSVNGGYEFFTTDEHGLGLTVRWVPKKNKKEGGKSESRRFNFSTISANTRRHPIIANLSKSTLDIYDSYKMPDLSTPTPAATPKQQATILEDGLDSDDNTSSKQELRRTDDLTRSIITMTSVYVAFKEGWSPHFKYDDHAPSSRRNSVHTPVSTPPASPVPNPAVLDKRSSILSVSSSIFRKSSLRTTRSSRTPTFSALDQTTNATEDLTPVRSTSTKATGRARADSNSTVLVHRAASNRRNNRPQATWRPDLLSAAKQSEMRETSRENTPVAEIKSSPQASRNASTAAGMASRRASILPDPEPEVDSDSEVDEPAMAAPAQREMTERHAQGTRASSNATSDSGASPKKQIVQVRLSEKDKKSKKWKRWICGKF
jgi:hypothetical protein